MFSTQAGKSMAKLITFYFATIYGLFDDDSYDAFMDIMQHLSIPSLAVQWAHSSTEVNLYVSGDLQVGPFLLDLAYQYKSAPAQGSSAWTFKAEMGTYTSSTNTLGQLVQDLAADSDVGAAMADAPFVNIIIPAASPPADADPPVAPHHERAECGNGFLDTDLDHG